MAADTYDPYKLIEHVRALMRINDVQPGSADERLALIGACQLLRGLGVFPAMDIVDSCDRTDSGSWPEADDRSAAAYQATGSR
jgi:hypothetical protein